MNAVTEFLGVSLWLHVVVTYILRLCLLLLLLSLVFAAALLRSCCDGHTQDWISRASGNHWAHQVCQDKGTAVHGEEYIA